ncbi:MAG TPA: sigma-70 family RNA polymerase sigma factor [Anaerolineales bacterium]|jgi:RNA polymerase sigma factor, sigma-70 family
MRTSPNDSALESDANLIERAATGDLEAFNQLVLRYQNLAYSHAYGMLGNPAQAEDATQESFIKAFQAINTFRGASFRAWLLKIVTNSAYDVLRRSHRHPTQPLLPEDENGEELESAAWLVDPSADVQEVVEQHELSQQVYQALGELPEAFRSVLTLIDVNEMDYTEAAQALNIPLGTVKSRLARARLQMQQKLKTISTYQNHGLPNAACLAV